MLQLKLSIAVATHSPAPPPPHPLFSQLLVTNFGVGETVKVVAMIGQ